MSYSALNEITASNITRIGEPPTKSEERNMLLIQRGIIDTEDSVCIDNDASALLGWLL